MFNKKKFIMKNLFFDLDGTIWDASNSTAIAWSRVFKRWDINHEILEKDIQSVAGKPYMECLNILAPEVIQHKDIDSILIELAIEEKKTMKEVGGKYYRDALETIVTLSTECQLFLVSNCNDWYLKAFLNHSGLDNVFIECVCFGTFNQNKVANLIYLKNKYNIQSGYYIGDTKGDMNAAHEVGLNYIHIKHGFDKTLNHDVVVEDFLDFITLFDTIEYKK